MIGFEGIMIIFATIIVSIIALTYKYRIIPKEIRKND